MRQQIFILGHYGWKNTGDDAMIYALLQELYLSYPKSTFAVFSPISIVVPTETKHLVKFVKPIPRIVFREIMKSKVFILGGGTHFYDYEPGNKIKRMKIMLQMFIIILWAKLFCEKVCLVGIGIEPFSTKWGKTISIMMCKMADFISVRDTLSYNFLNEHGLGRKVTLSFDLAALLSVPSKCDYSKKNMDEKVLGVSILPFFEIYHYNKEEDCKFIDELCKSLNQWLKRNEHSKIYLFVFKGKSRSDDVLITEMLQKKIGDSEKVKIVTYNPNPIEMLCNVAQCHSFVGMRYHSCVFAYLTKTPLLIINYFQKCQALAEDIGLTKDAIVSIEDVLNGKFQGKLEKLQDSPDKFIAKLPIDTAIYMAKKSLPDGDESI